VLGAVSVSVAVLAGARGQQRAVVEVERVDAADLDAWHVARAGRVRPVTPAPAPARHLPQQTNIPAANLYIGVSTYRPLSAFKHRKSTTSLKQSSHSPQTPPHHVLPLGSYFKRTSPSCRYYAQGHRVQDPDCGARKVDP